jgi:hypothetical protein
MRRLYAVITGGAIGGGLLISAAAFLYHHPGIREQFFDQAQQAGHVFLFAALAWAAYFVGRLVTRAAFRPRENWWEVELAVGWVIFGGGAFALAVAGALYVWVVRGIVLAVLALSAPTLWRLLGEAGERFRRAAETFSPGAVAWAVAAAPFAVVLVSGVGPPPYAWDALVYHLYLPREFLAHHGFYYLPRLAYASMPLGAEMMFTWAYAWDGLGVAAAVAPLFNGLMLVATWRVARRYVEPTWAAAAVVLLLFTPTFALVFNTAYTDFVLAALAMMAFAVYLNGLGSRGEAALAGVLLGAALAVKYTALHALLGMAAVAALDVARRRLRLGSAAVLFAAAFAVMLPWLVKAYVERGNPVFPVLYGVFGGRDLSPEAAAGIHRSMRAVGMGRGWLDYLLLPYRASVEGGGGYVFFAGSLWPFSFLVVPLALAWFRRWRLLIFTVITFASWAVIGSQQLRFLGAAYGTLAVLSAGVFAAGVAVFPAGRARRVATAAVTVALLALGYAMGFSYGANCAVRFVDYQRQGQEEFLAKWAPCYAANRFVNEDLPEGAVVLQVFDNCSLYLEREAISDPFCDASQIIYDVERLESPAAVAAYVEGLGATHILTNKTAALYFGSFYDREARARWEAYLRAYTTVIYDDGEYEVRAVNVGNRVSG